MAGGGLNSGSHVYDVVTLDALEWARNKAIKNGKVLLLQFGHSDCKLCPAFTAKVEELYKEYDFMYGYCDTHSADDLLEEYGVTRVPSFVLFKEHSGSTFINATIEQLESEVKSVCTPSLVLDKDF